MKTVFKINYLFLSLIIYNAKNLLTISMISQNIFNETDLIFKI